MRRLFSFLSFIVALGLCPLLGLVGVQPQWILLTVFCVLLSAALALFSSSWLEGLGGASGLLLLLSGMMGLFPAALVVMGMILFLTVTGDFLAAGGKGLIGRGNLPVQDEVESDGDGTLRW